MVSTDGDSIDRADHAVGARLAEILDVSAHGLRDAQAELEQQQHEASYRGPSARTAVISRRGALLLDPSGRCGRVS
jgi:hypothetical protein